MVRQLFFLSAFLIAGFTGIPQTAADVYIKGNELKKIGKASEAAAAFKEVVRLDPSHKEAWYGLGWCQNDMKEYDAAVTSLSTSRNLGYVYAALYFELGYALEKLGKIDSAIVNYNRCLSINPSYSLVFKQLGNIAYTKNDNAVALQHYKKYEELAKTPINDYLYWYRRGFTNNALKNYEDAKVSLNKSVVLKQDYINTYLELGFAASRLKQNDEAIGFYNRAIATDPKSHIPYNGIAEVYRDNIKNMEEAMKWYGKSLAINSKERKASFGMGYCLNSLGKYNEALPYLKTAIEQEPTYVAAYTELGYANYMTRNYTVALENLQKALSLNPANENARYYSGLIYIAQGNKAMAQKMVDDLKEMSSKNATTLQDKVNKM